MKANADKCHVSLRTSNELTVKINEAQIKNNQLDNLLGITNDLRFEDQINNVWRKASAKISALLRIVPYMDLPKRRKIMNAFFKSQFSYSPLTWMMHNRKLNNKKKSFFPLSTPSNYDFRNRRIFTTRSIETMYYY